MRPYAWHFCERVNRGGQMFGGCTRTSPLSPDEFGLQVDSVMAIACLGGELKIGWSAEEKRTAMRMVGMPVDLETASKMDK